MIFPASIHFVIFMATIYAVTGIYTAVCRMRNHWTAAHVLALLAMGTLTAFGYILGLIPLVIASR